MAAIRPTAPVAAGGYEILFREDPNLLDGRFSNNGWLMELPRPLTKITWDNAIHISPKLAQAQGVQSEDLIELQYGGGKPITGAVWVMPGQADDTVVVHLGFGRTSGGTIATGAGFDVNPMRSSKALW